MSSSLINLGTYSFSKYSKFSEKQTCINFVISTCLFRNFDSISIKIKAKLLLKIKNIN